MIGSYPQRVYFFNDAEFAIEDFASAEEIAKVRAVFSQIARCIKSREVSVIDYALCKLNLQYALVPESYDEVVCIGSKGLALYEKVKHTIGAGRVRKLQIKRVFDDENLSSFDFDVIGAANVGEDLRAIAHKKVLVVDDVVYSGRTLDHVLQYLGTSNTVAVLTLVAMQDTRTAIGRKCMAGLVIPGGHWPAMDQDIWCFRDLIENDAVVYRTGTTQSFIECETLMKHNLFGADYGTVKAAIGEIAYLFR